MHSGVVRLAAIIILTVKFTLENYTCPSQCQCSIYVVRCTGKGLKVVPKEIPLTARVVDISDNPSIQIPRHYFLQFQHLFILRLDNCGQKGPLHLPWTIRELSLRDNLLRVDAVREMFSNKARLMSQIDLGGNKFQPSDMQHVLRYLPKTLEVINLDYNNITMLRRVDMRSFTNIKKLSMWKSCITLIEPHSFDHMKRLSQVFQGENELRHLPDNLFFNNKLLQVLHLEQNSLTSFNTSRLGLTQVEQLFLHSNKLKVFDTRARNVASIWLEDNKLEHLQSDMFRNSKHIQFLSLANNKIQHISEDTFSNIRDISHLLLQNNAITSLPNGLFNGMTIKTLLLQNNHLSNLSGIFDGMKQLPILVGLAGNKELKSLNGAHLQRIPHTSTLYLTCENLRRITDIAKMKVKVTCSPKADLIINAVVDKWLVCYGFQCQYIPNKMLYSCRACRPGYYSDCKEFHKIEGECQQCPPGSFYQDQPGSAECKVCRPGQFVPPERSPGTDPLDCRTCPMGTNTTIIAGTRACICLNGYARRYRFGPCQKCNDNGFDCKKDYQVLQNDFWMTWKGTMPDDRNQSTSLYNYNYNKSICQHMYHAFIANLHIANDTYDRATMRFNCQMPLPIRCPMPASCLGGIQPTCSPGYIGVLCAVCKKGYSKQFNHCVQCPQAIWAVMQFIAYIALFVIFFAIIFLTDQIIIQENQNSMRREQTYNRRTFADIILSSLKILIGFYPLLISIMHMFASVQWPNKLKIATNIFQYLQFEIIKLPSLRCIRPEWDIDAVAEFWIVFIITIMVPFLALLFYLLKSSYIHFQNLSPSLTKEKRYLCARNCTKVVALYLFATYQLMSTKIIQVLPLSCHSFCTGKQNGTCVHSMSFLRSDYSIPCPTMSDNKNTLIAGYICLIIIPLGLPIFLFFLLRSYASKQNAKIREQTNTNSSVLYQRYHSHDNGIGNDNDDDDAGEGCHYLHMTSPYEDRDNLFGASTVSVMTSALQFSYENYNSRCWYWEVIEMIRKVLMTTGIILLLGHTQMGLACTIIVAMTFAILHAIIKPMKNSFESAAQFLSLVLIPLNMAFGAVLQSKYKEKPSIISKGEDYVLFGIFLVAMNSSLVTVIFVRIFYIMGKKILSRMKKSK